MRLAPAPLGRRWPGRPGTAPITVGRTRPKLRPATSHVNFHLRLARTPPWKRHPALSAGIVGPIRPCTRPRSPERRPTHPTRRGPERRHTALSAGIVGPIRLCARPRSPGRRPTHPTRRGPERRHPALSAEIVGPTWPYARLESSWRRSTCLTRRGLIRRRTALSAGIVGPARSCFCPKSQWVGQPSPPTFPADSIVGPRCHTG
jgi:hypothetical protein